MSQQNPFQSTKQEHQSSSHPCIHRYETYPEYGTAPQRPIADPEIGMSSTSANKRATMKAASDTAINVTTIPIDFTKCNNTFRSPLSPAPPSSRPPSSPPLEPHDLIGDKNDSWFNRSRHRIGHIIESKMTHIIILTLTSIDIILVMLQIGASLLHLDETEKEHWTILMFEHTSLAIVSLFVVEILLKLYAFGPLYFWRGTKHGILHLLDALIILTSFILELVLRGAAVELSGLLIIFRLWRIIKLTGTVAIEVSEHDEARCASLEARIQQLERELEQAQLKIQRLERLDSHTENSNKSH
ncbi:hypothetical protein BX616_005721 [Lobosporangium transversale]|uniref:Voltage-gated hydrogen channel 1 n=1 Tax=Lobosporangium transversale TaxID=64571 RepID=A0A1Y2GK72_9FUNG|nr:hypothetical protein BCR41DRAFT_355678 [Lobosporangium transversale]KAF9897373.1 hypothetical protein BX616_005721 [Lobosporangium transversale]ORZ13409.1 hypothetical protein BCR41DRAFT_355678 [Lobosporangium transversale]|eukprot:XP_021880490.1 hypothetical protein BCR41DRAFT_355678 [Lobosporangium transversale]